MKKILALALALIMVLGLATTAFAAEATYSITINNEKAGHVYEAYQIFTGDLSNEADPDSVPGTNAKLANIQFAAGVSYSGAGVNIGTAEAPEYSKEAADLAYALEAGTLTVDQLLADLTLGGVDGTSGAQTDGKYVISNLTPGYYLVKDKDDTLDNKYDAYTKFILEVVENSVVNHKSSVPTVVKKVIDTNDSTGETTVRQDSADHDKNDPVPFILTATLGDTVSSYKTYKVVFHDHLDVGLTLDAQLEGNVVTSGVTVKVGANANSLVDKTQYFTITAATDANGTALTISCDDVKATAVGAGDNYVIEVTYTAHLNDAAKLGADGNANTVKLEFSNDPNWVAEGVPGETPPPPPTGFTPEDKVVVFTYQVEVDKVDDDGAALVGATFALYKQLPEKPAEDSDVVYITEKDKDGAEAYWTEVGTIAGTNLSEFVWAGVDDGSYMLKETVTPTGYNSIDPIYFTITATHDDNNADPHLTALDGGVFTAQQKEGNVFTGVLHAEIENKPGAVLPETGGMGTTMFYVIGGVLVLAAVVLLVTKKRMASAE